MDARQAARNLEVIRTLMERTCQYQLLTVLCFSLGMHGWLPGVWMLCYGQAALATSAYAPSPISWLGIAALLLGALTLSLGPAAAIWMMGLVFGVGHIVLGVVLFAAE